MFPACEPIKRKTIGLLFIAVNVFILCLFAAHRCYSPRWAPQLPLLLAKEKVHSTPSLGLWFEDIANSKASVKVGANLQYTHTQLQPYGNGPFGLKRFGEYNDASFSKLRATLKAAQKGETIDMSEEEFLYLEGSNNVQSFVHFPCSRIIKQEDVNPIKMQQKGGGNMHIVMVIQEALEEINFKNHLPKTFEFLSSIDGRSVHFKNARMKAKYSTMEAYHQMFANEMGFDRDSSKERLRTHGVPSVGQTTADDFLFPKLRDAGFATTYGSPTCNHFMGSQFLNLSDWGFTHHMPIVSKQCWYHTKRNPKFLLGTHPLAMTRQYMHSYLDQHDKEGISTYSLYHFDEGHGGHMARMSQHDDILLPLLKSLTERENVLLLYMGDHPVPGKIPILTSIGFNFVLPERQLLHETVYNRLKAHEETIFGHREIFDTLHDLFLNQGFGIPSVYTHSLLRNDPTSSIFPRKLERPQEVAHAIALTDEMKGVMLKEINAYPQCPAFTALWKNVKLTKLNDEDSVFAEITMLTDKIPYEFSLTLAYANSTERDGVISVSGVHVDTLQQLTRYGPYEDCAYDGATAETCRCSLQWDAYHHLFPTDAYLPYGPLWVFHHRKSGGSTFRGLIYDNAEKAGYQVFEELEQKQFLRHFHPTSEFYTMITHEGEKDPGSGNRSYRILEGRPNTENTERTLKTLQYQCVWPKKYKTIWDLLSRFPDTLQKLVSTELNNVLDKIKSEYLVFGVLEHYEEFLQLLSILRPAFFPSLAYRKLNSTPDSRRVRTPFSDEDRDKLTHLLSDQIALYDKIKQHFEHRVQSLKDAGLWHPKVIEHRASAGVSPALLSTRVRERDRHE